MSRANETATTVDQQHLARVRQRRLRSIWLDVRPLFLLIAAAIALGLGYWGFRRSQATAQNDVFDSFYRSLRLFGVTGGDLDGRVAWQLQIARVLAPAVVGYAAIRGLVAVFREQALLLRLRLFARRHIVVVGLGNTGFRLATSLSESGFRVVVIERNRTHPALPGCRSRGIAVIFGDATDPEVQATARCDRARHLFACSGSDATNLRVLAACSELAKDPGWKPATAHVFIETSSLWRSLLAAPLTMGSGAQLRADFLSLHDLAGRTLVDADPSVWSAKDASVHIVALVGGNIGRSAVAHTVRLLLTGYAETSITIIGPGAAQDRAALLDEAPWLERAATIEALPVDPAARSEAIPALESMTAALICDNDTAAGLATAQGLVAVTPDSSAPIVLLADDDRLGDSLDATGLRLSRVLSVGAVERALGPALLLDTTLETIARAKHERYVQLELSRGQTAMDNPSLVGWEELPESLKESNRRFADSLARKIRELGGRVTPRDPTAPPATELPLPLHVLEELAQAEHARWVEDLRADGWGPGEEDKDPVRKVHPLMVPWDDLPHEEQEKDRDAIRDLPALLEAAGLTLVLETDDAQSTGRDEGGLEGPIHEEAAG
jgi:voltage-gated potassium channel Kch